jgi:hypothetical protein
MNRCGSHAWNSGAQFRRISFRNRSGRRFRESFDGQTKAVPERGSSPKGCEDA